MKRGGGAENPYLVFQYTLEGSGVYELENYSWTLNSNDAFFAVIPSAHRYFFPEEEETWTYFWIVFHHPYLVRRVKKRVEMCGPVLTLEEEDPLSAKTIELIAGIINPSKADEFGFEGVLFDWLVGYERLAKHSVYPEAQRTQLLPKTRA